MRLFLKVLIIRNYGMLACGETIEIAWHHAFHLIIACRTQLKAVLLGADNLILSSEEASKQVRRNFRTKIIEMSLV